MNCFSPSHSTRTSLLVIKVTHCMSVSQQNFYIVIQNIYVLLILIQTFAKQQEYDVLYLQMPILWMKTYKHLCGSKQGSTSQCEGQGQLSGDVWLTALPSTSLISPHLIHLTTLPHLTPKAPSITSPHLILLNNLIHITYTTNHLIQFTP